jgi:ubiquinone biosynthesis accessory factor UbiJ
VDAENEIVILPQLELLGYLYDFYGRAKHLLASLSPVFLHPPTRSPMFQALQMMTAQAVMERLTLLINHVIAAEPLAQQRLVRHSGRCLALRFEGGPRWVPLPESIAFRITPAGLLDWCGPSAADVPAQPDLRVLMDVSKPLSLLGNTLMGERPTFQIAGDAAFASDVSWLIDNVRWDVEDDLARITGPMAARQIVRLGQAVAQALRDAAKRFTGFAGFKTQADQPFSASKAAFTDAPMRESHHTAPPDAAAETSAR